MHTTPNPNRALVVPLIARLTSAVALANQLARMNARALRQEANVTKTRKLTEEHNAIPKEMASLEGFVLPEAEAMPTAPKSVEPWQTEAERFKEGLKVMARNLEKILAALRTYEAGLVDPSDEAEEDLQGGVELTDPGVPRFLDLLLPLEEAEPPPPRVRVAATGLDDEQLAEADRIAKIVNEDQSVLPMPGARPSPGTLSGAKRAAGTPVPPPDGTPPGVVWTSHDEGRTLAWRTPASPNPNDARREERAEWGPGTLDEPVAPGPAVVPLFERAPAATGAKPPPRKGKEVRPPPMRVADKDGGDTSLLWIVWLVAGAVAVGVGFVFAVFYGGQVMEMVESTWESQFGEEVTSANSSTVANTGDGSQALDCSNAIELLQVDLDGDDSKENVVGVPVHGGATVLYMGGWSLVGGQCFLPNNRVASVGSFTFAREDLKRALGDSPRGEGMTNPAYNTAYGIVVCNPGSGPVTYCFVD